MRECFANEQRDCKHAGNCPNELCHDIKQRVPIPHFSKTPKSKSDRGIKMRAGSLAEGRENKRNRSAAHCDSRQHASCEFAGDEIENRRSRMMKQNREQPRRDHEQPELGCLAEIFWPMLAERSNHNRSPPATCLSLPKGEGRVRVVWNLRWRVGNPLTSILSPSSSGEAE